MKDYKKIDREALPEHFPTHQHTCDFWKYLGKAVATFGFMEEVLAKAICCLTGDKSYPKDQAESECKKWLAYLRECVSNPLGKLIEEYEKAMADNPKIEKVDETLILQLKSAAKWRNIICHGSWLKPNENGESIPWFVDKKGKICETKINVDYLRELQKSTTKLCCDVIDSLTKNAIKWPPFEERS